MHKTREFETFSPKWGCLYQIPPLLRAQELPTPTPRRGVRKSERVKGPGGCCAEFDVPGRPALSLRQTEKKWRGEGGKSTVEVGKTKIRRFNA